MKVCVTGASGQTGSIVTRKLVERSKGFVAVVRSEHSKAKLLKGTPGLKPGDVLVCSSFCKDELVHAFQGCEQLVILTSAMPKLALSSLPGVIFSKLMGRKGVRPSFYFAEGQSPKEVDWLMQREQIDAAVAAGVKHVVLISSMGGTQPDHFLNTMGDGKILLWKRKAEVYLKESGMKYTIVHPGGLLPHPGPVKESSAGGLRELRVGVDDEFLESEERTIPREDLAEVTIQCLTTPEAVNTSWDLVSRKEGVGVTFTSLSKLLGAAESLQCDYSRPALPV
ncbi:NAD(P)-binding domain-containing protein [Chloropicon primus]|uniref:NAD(P)-binding domain-containing protein n=1 Tax=Chloropicon primus TaxID=1764295 RepID=A0A5B8MVL4_9CHLO|nr:NAD(P)-binding domain-containing protein [Chloropicon primus]UPR02967.1 NAD(P)-binding domain-containing protein [Chloropicon primus]|mmetsp:Transcript_3805/g.10950  ORF Transcript_3805/g.10950 Transcript_3805/m.10950 type:complete len:281 (+) Transcript_3805:2030-2872(+)|eukprot:QDZ23754.1 NAD(P)-binding domain-containing protein [Chloropicon primus]